MDVIISTYNFPVGNKDPFDPAFDGNYFVFADKHSNLAKTLQVLTGNVLEQHIPMGRTTIIFCHRVALIEKGNVEQEWAFTEQQYLTADHYSGKYIVTASPAINGDSSYSSVWDTLEIATEEALMLSQKNTNTMLVSIILDTLMWH